MVGIAGRHAARAERTSVPSLPIRLATLTREMRMVVAQRGSELGRQADGDLA